MVLHTMSYLSGKDWTLETPKVYIVLGLNRSGTSLVANGLHNQGIDFGTDVWRKENYGFVKLNAKIIQAAGGIWKDPPPEADLLIQGTVHAQEIQDAIKSMSSRGSPLWGWKDPRQYLTVQSYFDYLPGDVYLIATFRRPEFAGASLRRCGQMSVEEGVKLSRGYAQRMIGVIKKFVGL